MIDVTTNVESGTEFRIGPIFGQTVSALKGNFGTYLLLASISIPPMAVYLLLTDSPEGIGVPGIELQVYYFTAMTLHVVLLSVAQAIIAYGVVQSLSGRDVSIGESIKQGLRRFFPLVGVAILVMLAVYIGLVLLVIPGLWLATLFWVSITTCVVERLGPVGSLKRSSDLSKGHRWKVFAIVAIFYFGSFGIGFGLRVLAGPTIAAWFDLVLTAILGAIGGVLAATMYSALRRAKDGIDIQSIAGVFE